LAAAACAWAQPNSDAILKAAREALGPKVASIRTLSAWGSHRRGAGGGTQMAVSLDMAGMFLIERSSLTNSGEIQRASGDGNTSGGMPGDDGGPALALGLVEGISGDNYWSRNGSGIGKRAFTAAFTRYALAFTMSPPFPSAVSFAYGGRLTSERGTVDAVECKGPDDFLMHVYLDATTHLPVTMVYHESGQEVQLWLKDYRPESGIQFPHLMAWLIDGSVVEEFQIQHFKVNPKLKPEMFRK
jgi:hypothetical protein